MKYCNKCGTYKALTAFGNNKTTSDGLSYYCKACKVAAQKDSSRTLGGLITSLWASQRSASEQRGHAPPNYTKAEFTSWLHDNGISTLYDAWVSSEYTKGLRPSCDRIDDFKPYTLSNIRLVTWAENDAKAHSDHKAGIGTTGSACMPVIRTDSDGVEVRFVSLKQASRESGTSDANIGGCCHGKQLTAGGYKWRFA